MKPVSKTKSPSSPAEPPASAPPSCGASSPRAPACSSAIAISRRAPRSAPSWATRRRSRCSMSPTPTPSPPPSPAPSRSGDASTSSSTTPASPSPPAALPARTGVFTAYNATNRYYAFSGAGASPPIYGIRSNLSQSRGYDSLLPTPYSLEHSVTDEALYPYDVNYTGNSNQMKAATSIGGVIGEFNPFRNFYVEAGYNRETYNQRFVRFLPLSACDLFVDGNRFLQDRTTPNPNFGRYYLESPAARTGRNLSRKEQARLSLSYDADFESRTGWLKWLGRHRLAALLDRNATDFFNGRSDFKVLDTPTNVSNSFFLHLLCRPQ